MHAYLLLACAALASGAVPPSQLQALKDLYTATDGAHWDQYRQWDLSNPEPCTWPGVQCDAAASTITCVNILRGLFSEIWPCV